MHVINGQVGVGTAYSTYSTSHNPLDVVRWLQYRLKLNNTDKDSNKDTDNSNNTNITKRPVLVPWYRDFTGSVSLILKKDSKLEKLEREAEKEQIREELEKAALQSSQSERGESVEEISDEDNEDEEDESNVKSKSEIKLNLKTGVVEKVEKVKKTERQS